MNLDITYLIPHQGTERHTIEDVRSWDLLFLDSGVLAITFDDGSKGYINKDYLLSWEELPEETDE